MTSPELFREFHQKLNQSLIKISISSTFCFIDLWISTVDILLLTPVTTSTTTTTNNNDSL